ncbi:hypothetical protein DL89DRAFT_266718 [Linderina pennispora]|uniref:Uncharacterized protein n=1 Tax=Linderina pennispora TaxID=61395 RepID=A0A1Y1WAV7_9FUNG|nr:uncharacterized protein DL89DRAFT_266718 [Linderina pennispora]ORX70505.1 hypothetical protein DL89DRAFT_266718 [Linderina pennispora]
MDCDPHHTPVADRYPKQVSVYYFAIIYFLSMSHLNTPISHNVVPISPQAIVFQAPKQKDKRPLYIALFFLAAALVTLGLMGYFISRMLEADRTGTYITGWGHHIFSNSRSYYEARVGINASVAGICLILAIIYLVKYKRS